MVPAAIITSGVSIFQGVQSLLGGSSDPERLAANQRAYDAAIQGDDNALEYLRARSIQNSNVSVPGYGTVSGWATATARADAAAKYQQAKQVREVNGIAQEAGAQVQNLAGRQGFAIIPTDQAKLAVMVVGFLLLVVALGWLRKRS